MLAAAEVVPVKLSLVVVVVPGLMAWLRIAARVHQRTLYHLAVVTTVSQCASSLKIVGLLHHHPLLHSRLQSPQEHIPRNNVIQPLYTQLQL